MITENIQVNKEILGRFATLIKNGRLAHAYLFTGQAYIGKGETARGIAKLVNCENTSSDGQLFFCDECPVCKRINSGNHPDVSVIESDFTEPIKIDEIRNVLKQVKLRPFMAEKKIIIIRNIENLTQEASNAFLKTLEEPAGNSLLLLTTSIPEKILDTVKSRCHTVYFYPCSRKDLAARLKKCYAGEDVNVNFLAYFAEGCPGEARRLKEDGIFERKRYIIDNFIFSEPDENFIKKILADKKKMKEFLDILSSWVRDSILAKSGMLDDRFIHCDRAEELREFQSRYSFDELKVLGDHIINMYKMLADNFNVKIPLLIIKEELWTRQY